MPELDSTTTTRSFHHLTATDRGQIQALHHQGLTQTEIAERLGVSQATISRELKRGTVTQMTSQYTFYQVYQADAGQRVADENRKASGRVRHLERYSSAFFDALPDALCPKGQFRVHSVDSFVHTYKKDHPDEKVPSTKTVYTYIDLGLLAVKNIDLPRKVTMRQRKTKPSEPRGTNRKKLGTSIDERDSKILTRQEFGHWELDLVLGKQGKEEPVIITLLERKTRMYMTAKFWSKSADRIADKVWKMLEPYAECGAVKTVTTDNGSEFASLPQLEDREQFKVYFAHAYSSWEKGSNERHNGLLREFLPKGQSFKSLRYETLQKMTEALNKRPRKILNYVTPEELFTKELGQLSQTLNHEQHQNP